MKFLNPWGFLFFISIPGIIILYLLKQQNQEMMVSSTFLWERTMQNLQASVPWQRLRANILLILQLMALVLFSLGISQPFLYSREEKDDYIIILDSSASMQATDIKPSRFQRAKSDIEKLIDGMLPHQRMTLVEASDRARILANQVSDKATLKAKLGQIKETNGFANMVEAFEFVRALAKEEPNSGIYLYSDQYHKAGDNEDNPYNTIIYNDNGQNRAVQSVTYSYDSNTPIILSAITNYGSDSMVSVECLADGRLIDVKEVSLSEGETKNIYWDNIPTKAQRIEIHILDEDDLMADNRAWAILSPPSVNRVLLVTTRNTFLEKAIGLRGDLELDKTTLDGARDIGGYDLYVYDGYTPPELPEDGSVILFNPVGTGDILNIGDIFNPGAIRLNSRTSYRDLVNYITPEDFHIAEARILEKPPWAEMVLEDEKQRPIMMVGQLENQRIAIFPFEIHKSDLPLKSDFPILMQNLLGWMLPQIVDYDAERFAGDEVEINPFPHAQKVTVENPYGLTMDVGPPFPIPPFSETQEVGVYKVRQRIDEKDIEGYFTVHIPTLKESDLRLIDQPSTETKIQTDDRLRLSTGKSVWHYFIWAVLILILAEWWVYQRGY
ncbi:MAG TPA: VWA domain-containing protein [Clostridia bacterium]|nr:VWA domain-containing protein [Clostridia bacterium]